MPDLQDGESVEIKGSACLPYTLKNVGGIYSCRSSAWLSTADPRTNHLAQRYRPPFRRSFLPGRRWHQRVRT